MSGITIRDHGTGERPAEDEPTWDTETLQRDFEVLGFMAPYVLVRRKSDRVKGLLQFAHSPRVYWDFSAS
jgi:hypothetical protein